MQNQLLFPHQAADVRLCDADEAGGTAGRRLLLHWLSVLWSHRLCHRPRCVSLLIKVFSCANFTLIINRIRFYLLNCPKLVGNSAKTQKNIITLKMCQSCIQLTKNNWSHTLLTLEKWPKKAALQMKSGLLKLRLSFLFTSRSPTLIYTLPQLVKSKKSIEARDKKLANTKII